MMAFIYALINVIAEVIPEHNLGEVVAIERVFVVAVNFVLGCKFVEQILSWGSSRYFHAVTVPRQRQTISRHAIVAPNFCPVRIANYVSGFYKHGFPN
jgi:hypothetical protein